MIDLSELIIEPFSNELAQQYLQTSTFAFDIETDTSDYHWNTGDRGLSYVSDITHISFYSDGIPAMVLAAKFETVDYEYERFNIDTEEFELHAGVKYLFQFSDDEIEFIRSMFQRDYYVAIAHNLVFDARQIFGKFNINVPKTAHFWDTQAIHVFGAWGADFEDDEEENNNTSMSLFNLTAHWLTEADREWWASLKGERGNLTRLLTDEKHRNKTQISDVEVDRYVAVDSVMAYLLYDWQSNEIENNGFDEHFDESKKVHMDSMATLLQIDLDYIRLCVEMASNGVAANIPFLKEELVTYTRLWKQSLINLGLTVETEELFRKKSWQQSYIFKNITMPDDLSIIEDYKLKTAKGAWSFSKKAIAYYIESYDELILYRYHADLETKLKQINNFLRQSEYDGRIHFILSRHAVTGRNISSLPNMQNLKLKNKTPYRRDLKAKYGISEPGLDVGYVMADEGCVLVSLDCSNAETWMEAMYAIDDAKALALCKQDFHTAMAMIYFANEWDTLTDKEKEAKRSLGKNITFGTAFGMGTKRLAREIRVSLQEAKAFIENRNRTFWRVEEAKSRASSYAQTNGHTILWTGRRVAIHKKDGEYKGYTAWNGLTQGGVGELIVRSMLQTSQFLNGDIKQRIVSQVHDEVIIQIDPANYEALMQPIIEILSSIIPDIWNNRTTPPCRWLFTLDNIENSHKWGYDPYTEYPLPLNEYVNRWGHHLYTEADRGEAPTWINEYGFGEAALNKELGISDDNDDQAVDIIVDNFDWSGMGDTIKQCSTLLNNVVIINNQTFTFPHSLHALRAMYHKGLDNSYLQYLESFDKLVEVAERYKEWKQ